MTLRLDGATLSCRDVVSVARSRTRVELDLTAEARLQRIRTVVDGLVATGQVVYGLTTGVGDLRTTRIAPEHVKQLQRNLLMSHAVGVGPDLPEDVVRAAMLARVNQFAQGSSGVRVQIATALLDLLNADICPRIPEKGSLGASGDLAPSAHMGLVLIGAGEVVRNGQLLAGGDALRSAGLHPVDLEAKDGLSILNGTHFMAGAGALLVADGERVLKTADLVLAMSVEALKASRSPFDPRIHAARPHPGQVASAARVWQLTEGSGIVESHAMCDRVQDAYSIRCAPQVHGASIDAIAYLKRVVEIDLNAGTDNPMVFADGPAVLSGGNFHGQPLALALDFAGLALAEIGSISERRLFRLLTGHLSQLPPFLTRHSGLDSGYMLLQYAAAALASENQVLATPASIHSLSTSADQEDDNSMGWQAALKARQILGNVETILALEALAAAQGIDLLAPLKPAAATRAAQTLIRERVPVLDHDRVLEPEIRAATELVRSGALSQVVDNLAVSR